MNMLCHRNLLCFGFLLCIGCASVPGRPADDPALMLRQASLLYTTEDDPIAAERMIREAMELSVARQDLAALAEAYRQYGLFFRSTAVGKFEAHYGKRGFLDRSVRFPERYQASIRYFKAAERLFAEQDRNADLSNVALGMAKTYLLMGDRNAACASFDLSLEYYREHRSKSVSPDQAGPDDADGQEGYIRDMQAQSGCTR